MPRERRGAERSRSPERPVTFADTRNGIEAALSPFETGVICVAGPPARGYYLDDAANEKAFRDGWFRTGELGHLDAEGHLHITGRSRDVFISGGFDVHPRETGELLPTHPTPSAVAVPCVLHPCRGEVGLVVCACQPERGVSEDELGELVSGRLAKYEVPQRFVFPDEMLETGYGRITERPVRDELEVRGLITAPPA